MTSLREHSQLPQRSNPYAAPTVSEGGASSVQWGVGFVIVLLFFSAVAQFVLTVAVMHRLRESFAGIEAPFVHLIVTSSLIVASAVVLVRGCTGSIAFRGAQAVNRIHWGVFVLTIQSMVSLGLADQGLSYEDCWIFFGIFLAGAVVTGLVCVLAHKKEVAQVAKQQDG